MTIGFLPFSSFPSSWLVSDLVQWYHGTSYCDRSDAPRTSRCRPEDRFITRRGVQHQSASSGPPTSPPTSIATPLFPVETTSRRRISDVRGFVMAIQCVDHFPRAGTTNNTIDRTKHGRPNQAWTTEPRATAEVCARTKSISAVIWPQWRESCSNGIGFVWIENQPFRQFASVDSIVFRSQSPSRRALFTPFLSHFRE